MLAHARTVRLFHSLAAAGTIGIVQQHVPVLPGDRQRGRRRGRAHRDAVYNRWFIDPSSWGVPARGDGPVPLRDILPEMEREDLDVFADDTVDFIGVNYYFPHHASADATETFFGLNTSGNKDEDCQFSIEGLFKFVRNPRGRYTDWAWEILPAGLYDLLVRAHRIAPECRST